VTTSNSGAGSRRAGDPAPLQPGRAQTAHNSAQPGGASVDADFAYELVATGATTQPVETVIAVLRATEGGASINAAAKASGINYRTARRIADAAAKLRQPSLMALG
jgi:hypothetical protein